MAKGLPPNGVNFTRLAAYHAPAPPQVFAEKTSGGPAKHVVTNKLITAGVFN